MHYSHGLRAGKTSRAISMKLAAAAIVIIVVAMGATYYYFYHHQAGIPGSGLDEAGFGTSIATTPGGQNDQFGFSLKNVGANSVKGVSISISTPSGGQIVNVKWSGNIATNQTLVILATNTGISASTGTATGSANLTGSTASPGGSYTYTISLTFSDSTTQTYSGSGTVSG